MPRWTLTAQSSQPDLGGAEVSYSQSDLTKVTAKPNAGYVLSHWQGDVPIGKETNDPLILDLRKHSSVSAVFREVQIFALNVELTGQGSVDPNSGTYEEGEAVEVSATPADGWEFVRWEGDVPPDKATDNPLKMVIDGACTLRAVFAESSRDGLGDGGVWPACCATQASVALSLFGLWLAVTRLRRRTGPAAHG